MGDETDETADDTDVFTLGCWDGSDAELQRLRTAGFGGLLLKDACGGDVGRGAGQSSPSLAAQRVSVLLRAALSKGSRKWSGSMFGSEKKSDGQSLDTYFDR